MRVPIRKGSGPIYGPLDPKMTQEKYEELKNKLDFWLKVRRPRDAEEVKRLALEGDFSENVGYQVAKGRLRGLNQSIINLEKLLKRAEIINKNTNLEEVNIGAKVKIKIGDNTRVYTILGSSETDPTNNIISHLSPLGANLLGRKLNEKFIITLNKKEKRCQILEIL